jgi:hypothetical protein
MLVVVMEVFVAPFTTKTMKVVVKVRAEAKEHQKDL